MVKFPSGMLRVVRSVSWGGPKNNRGSFSFSIQRCSWTGRCYTTYTSTDLRTMGCTLTRATVRLNKKIDKQIKVALTDGAWSPVKPYTLKCCDVIGVVT